MGKTLSVAEIMERRARLARQLSRGGALLRGSLARRWISCGRVGCACAGGKKHGPYLYLSVFGGGKTKSIYVPRTLEKEVRQWVQNVRAVESDLVEITRLNAELLRAEAEEERRRGRGRRDLSRKSGR
jgi:hypothetical protein